MNILVEHFSIAPDYILKKSLGFSYYMKK